MSAAMLRERAEMPDRWSIRLPCGHEVDVPWGSSVPAQMACVLHHQVECTDDVVEVPAARWTGPFDRPGLARAP